MWGWSSNIIIILYTDQVEKLLSDRVGVGGAWPMAGPLAPTLLAESVSTIITSLVRALSS